MKSRWHSALRLACAATLVVSGAQSLSARAEAQENGVVVNDGLAGDSQYWTPEMMGEAQPMELVVEDIGGEQVPFGVAEGWTEEQMRSAIPMDRNLPAPRVEGTGSAAPEAAPGVIPGWDPSGGLAPPDPAGRGVVQQSSIAALTDAADGGVLPQTMPPFSPPSSPADYANYSPFNRWTWYGNYLTWPTSTIGRLFFTQNGVRYVCSASVIARNTIATAGHCMSDGNGNWSTNVVFCPSYYRGSGSGSPHPLRGCWSVIGAATSTDWHIASDIDRDYACGITAATGTVVNNSVGNVTGWIGRAWNFSTRMNEFAWGYPSADPFPGYHIIVSASTEWYQIDMDPSDSQASKYIGSDKTGGSSGGPWFFAIRHKNITYEYPDVDGSNLTDYGQDGVNGAGGPYLNGVNSHSRCNQLGCPPGSIYLSEMGSPQFRNTSAGGESEDVFNACFNSGGT